MPSQAHELPAAPALLDRLPGAPLWVVTDRGYGPHGFRAYVWNSGTRPAIPSKRTEAPVACPAWVDTNRNCVERPCGQLEE